MNLLTGKAKQDFEKWMKNNQGYIYPDTPSIKVRSDIFLNIEFTPESMQYGIIIEWLDSVDIYLSINITPITKRFEYSINREIFVPRFETRNEATKAAILTAQDLFNNG